MKVYLVKFPKGSECPGAWEEIVSEGDTGFTEDLGGIVIDMLGEDWKGPRWKIFLTRGVKNSLTVRESGGGKLSVLLAKKNVVEIEMKPREAPGNEEVPME